MKNIIQLSLVLSTSLLLASCEKEDQLTSPLNSESSFNTTAQETDGMEHNFGCLKTPQAILDKIPVLEDEISIQTLPSSVSLKCPTIRSQGSESSCVAWGIAYAARSIWERNQAGGSFSTTVNVYSPEYVFNQIKLSGDCSHGSYPTDAFDLLENEGVCLWATMPYSSTNGCSTMPSSTATAEAAYHKISGWGTVSKSLTSIKNKLNARKPIIICSAVDDDFSALGYNDIWNASTYAYIGRHCYVIVGYDDSKNAFKIMNSWGDDWGTNGYGWMSYDMFTCTNISSPVYWWLLNSELYSISGIL